MKKQTIVSMATPFGFSSIGIIRLSGVGSFSLASRLSKTKKKRVHMEAVLLPVYEKNNKKIDTAIYTFFKTPKSYTGENVVEVSCHGNPTIIGMIIKRIITLGARLAEPGEYTKRAFLNGKMSLSQAESVALLIAARSERAVYNNTKIIEGETSIKIIKIKNHLLEALSTLEYELDVSEHEKQTINSLIKVSKLIKNSILSIGDVDSSYRVGLAHNSGFRVVIIGRPNTGKSTLMNALLGKNRSITSSTPGTTRDTITQDLVLNGCPITLVDTAGFREAKSSIEREGLRRGALETNRADLVLSVFCKGVQPIEKIEFIKNIYVYNKIDLHIKPVDKKEVFNVSALNGNGIKKLLNKVQGSLFTPNQHVGETLINTERQFQAVKACLRHATLALDELSQENTKLELVAFETRKAIDSLDSFLGKTTTDDILDGVFSNFCVGK